MSMISDIDVLTGYLATFLVGLMSGVGSKLAYDLISRRSKKKQAFMDRIRPDLESILRQAVVISRLAQDYDHYKSMMSGHVTNAASSESNDKLTELFRVGAFNKLIETTNLLIAECRLYSNYYSALEKTGRLVVLRTYNSPLATFLTQLQSNCESYPSDTLVTSFQDANKLSIRVYNSHSLAKQLEPELLKFLK